MGGTDPLRVRRLRLGVLRGDATGLRLRRSCDDQGYSFVERGAEQLCVCDRMRSILRLLAIFAFLQVAYIGVYFVP
jgi:hypothetical protein